MYVKMFDCNHEEDLEEELNEFFAIEDIEIIDVKYQLAIMYDYKDQIYCYSAMVLYNLKKIN